MFSDLTTKKNIEFHGGLTGINYSQIIDSYAVSSVGGGAVCGINEGKIIRCYGNGSSESISVVRSGKEIDSWVVRTAAKLQKKMVATWDFNRIWSFNKKGFPVFKNDSWYIKGSLKENDLIIDTEDKLLDFANQIWLGNKKMAQRNVLISADLNLKNKKMKPIGTCDNPYTGIFDGAGHVISNFKIVIDEDVAIGLFGVVSKAKICNLTVKGNVYGGTNTGLLCGVNDSSEILCCGSIGEVRGYGYVGGLCGNNRGTIIQCNFYGYIRRRKHYGSFKWLMPIGAIFLLEVGIITVLAITSPNAGWNGIYKPIEEEKYITPILNNSTEEKVEGTNSVRIRVDNEALYSGGEKMFLTMSNPYVSNQNAVMEVLIAKEYVKGEITYEEAKIYDAEYEYYVVAKTGAIPPGYQVECFNWLGYSEEVLESGDYPAFVKMYFYDEQTNEKSLVDSLFRITLKID